MEGHLVRNRLRRRSELITWKGLSLCSLAPGGPQGHPSGCHKWNPVRDSLIALRNKAKQTDGNMRINFPIFPLSQKKFGFSH